MRNLQEQVKKNILLQKILLTFHWLNSDLKKKFSQPLAQFFLILGQNNFGNKIPFLYFSCRAGGPEIGFGR